MKNGFPLLKFALSVIVSALPVLTSAECDPGPASGGSVSRCYDDGFVFVDATGNAGGLTVFWGYQSSTQLPGNDTMVFHKCLVTPSNTVVHVSDTYLLNGMIPPPAPYSGSFLGPGPLLADSPVSRSTATELVPPTTLAATNHGASLTFSWPVSAIRFDLQSSTNVSAGASTVWNTVTNAATIEGSNYQVSLSSPAAISFFRLISAGCN